MYAMTKPHEQYLYAIYHSSDSARYLSDKLISRFMSPTVNSTPSPAMVTV